MKHSTSLPNAFTEKGLYMLATIMKGDIAIEATLAIIDTFKLSCYVVVEVKIGEFDFADSGQLGGYVVACNHLLRKEGRDNPTIGLLICKQKNHTLAQYALESSSQPLENQNMNLKSSILKR